MSHSVDIFLKAKLPLEDIANLLQDKLQLRFSDWNDGKQKCAEAPHALIYISNCKGDYEDDQGIPFSLFNIEIAINPLKNDRSLSPEALLLDCDKLANRVARALTEGGFRPDAVIENLQRRGDDLL